MAKKHLLIALVILAAALLLGGLIYCRPTAVDNYAVGLFDFVAVDEVSARLEVYTDGGTQQWTFALNGEDPAFAALIDRFDGKGFGRTLGNLIPRGEGYVRTHPMEEGDVLWEITFTCSVSGGYLRMENWYGDLYVGPDDLAVTTNDKDEWIGKITGLLTELIPPEEPKEDVTEE